MYHRIVANFRSRRTGLAWNFHVLFTQNVSLGETLSERSDSTRLEVQQGRESCLSFHHIRGLFVFFLIKEFKIEVVVIRPVINVESGLLVGLQVV